MNVVTLTVRTD